MRKFFSFMMVFVILLGVVACSGKKTETATKKHELIISAAASMKESLEEVKVEYEKKHPEVTITYNFGASGALKEQIQNGATVDLFISASNKHMNELVNENMMKKETITDVVKNKLVLIVPNDSKWSGEFSDIVNFEGKHIGLGTPETVPAGEYAKESLLNLGIFDQTSAKFVFAKDVKEVLRWVETGNVEAGIVYRSDAMSSQKVKEVAVAPDESHSPIVYPGGILANSKYQDDSQEFLNFLKENQAKAIFEKHGFSL